MNLCFLHLICSSGTSGGEPKMMPSIAEDLNRRTFLYNLIMPIMNQLDSSVYISHLHVAFNIIIPFFPSRRHMEVWG